MEVNIKGRKRARVNEIEISKCFGLITRPDEYFMRIDSPKMKVEAADIIYCVNLSTGEVNSFDDTLLIEPYDLKVEEVKKVEKVDEPDTDVEVLEPREITEG